MEQLDGIYRCPVCRRSYKCTSTPDKCAVCGADGRAARPEDPVMATTDKFKLAAERAKGNF